MNPVTAEQFFTTVKPEIVNRYVDYWNSIRPVTIDDFFRRYLFAFTSVHTSWRGNVRGYNAIKNLGWLNDKENLRSRLIRSKCGMHNNRTNYIWDFKEKFYSDVEKFTQVRTDWQTYRNELVNEINGLGVAKVSFTLEMCFPAEAKVSCIDTHGIQLYELPTDDFKSKKGMELYEAAENHWLECSDSAGCPSTIARSIYWDRKQKRRNSRYWTYVLEN